VKLITTALVLSAALAMAGCAKSSPATPTVTPTPGVSTETITATITGAKAAADLNSHSSAPLVFPVMRFTGTVSTSVRRLSLGGGKAGTSVFKTPAGHLDVRHVQTSSGRRTWTGPLDGVCMFTAVFSAGRWTATGGTGKFAGASGHGTFRVTASGATALKKHKTRCSAATTGRVQSAGAEITFTASGTLKK
jgi:hypothetical protein